MFCDDLYPLCFARRLKIEGHRYSARSKRLLIESTVSIMASSDPDVRRFLLAKEFGEVFQSQQFQPIAVRGLTQAYQSKYRKNFSPCKLGFSRNLDYFVDELPIFSRCHAV